jgi:hypothetical protein
VKSGAKADSRGEVLTIAASTRARSMLSQGNLRPVFDSRKRLTLLRARRVPSPPAKVAQDELSRIQNLFLTDDDGSLATAHCARTDELPLLLPLTSASKKPLDLYITKSSVTLSP